jgi:dTDP-4-amino-4,6-dideoxygalactose transaminase
MAGDRNIRLGEMQAVIHSEFLQHLDEGNARRNQITERYRKEIKQADIVHPQGDSDGAGRPRNQGRRPSNNWCMQLTSRVLFANFKARD